MESLHEEVSTTEVEQNQPHEGRSITEEFGKLVLKKFKSVNTIKATARAMQVSRNFVRKVIRNSNANGGDYKRISNRKGREKIISEDDEAWLDKHLQSNPDLQLFELTEDLLFSRLKLISISTARRTLFRLRMTRKKLVAVARKCN